MNNNTLPLNITLLNKHFRTQQVLSDISLSVQPGEIFGLLGLNGVGKTTLIKIILDLLRADSGEASFFGVSSRKPLSRQNICYLPEKFQPSSFLKGYEFLELALSYYNIPLDHEQAHILAETLDLKISMLNQKISKYSKGMSQKLGLMSVLLSNAPLLILDEPMSGLDPVARVKLKSLLLSYQQANKSIFFSSHILSDIDEICHRIAVIADGKLAFLGKPTELKEKYQQVSLELAFLKAIEGTPTYAVVDDEDPEVT